MNIKPNIGKVLVRMDDKESSVKGLYVPNSVNNAENTGVVIATGEYRAAKNGNLFPLAVKVGDRIVVDKFSGMIVDDQDDKKTTYKIIPEELILGIVTE